MEDPTPEGNFLKDDTKAVHITGLGATGRRRSHPQEFRCSPQFFCGSEVRSHRRRAPKLRDKALYILIGEGKLANAIIKVRQHGLIIPRKERVIQFKVSWEEGSG